MQVIVDGLMTSYSRVGKGKQVLLLHGWADTSASWQAFANELAKHYEVIVPDLPGFGGTQRPTDTWGLNGYAEFVTKFVKKLALKPYCIIGHSNGGGIAIRGLASGELAAEKLVLLASAGIRTERSGQKTALKLATKTGKMLAKPLPTRLQRKLRSKLYQRVGSDMLVAENMQETFKKVVGDDVQSDARRLATPTLLVYGQQDTATQVRYGMLLHELIEGSTLEVIPEVGHFLHLENKEGVVQLVDEFLA
jgi:pimeloyl-ACP methyl ester carboxylesterase